MTDSTTSPSTGLGTSPSTGLGASPSTGLGTSPSAEKKPVVDPGLYSKEYFLGDNEGWQEYQAGLQGSMHPKFARALALASLTKEDTVLDIGCGRGELLYYCASRGIRAFGIDYSKAAIELARQAIERLPKEKRQLARAEVGEASAYDFREQFTVVFMIETLEHMHDWQLTDTFARLETALATGGRLVMITPNYFYERYLSPAKRIFDLPLNLLKAPLRMLKPKYKKAGFAALVRKAFRIIPDRGEINRQMHVNVTTPARVRSLVRRFDADVWCEDPSKNVLSLIMKRWWGRDIVAVARRR